MAHHSDKPPSFDLHRVVRVDGADVERLMRRLMDNTLGPTGRFPAGALAIEDQGELRFSIGTRDDKIVFLFGKAITYLGLTMDQALHVAREVAARVRHRVVPETSDTDAAFAALLDAYQVASFRFCGGKVARPEFDADVHIARASLEDWAARRQAVVAAMLAFEPLLRALPEDAPDDGYVTVDPLEERIRFGDVRRLRAALARVAAADLPAGAADQDGKPRG